MEIDNILAIINCLLAFIAIPPSIALIKFLFKERFILDTKKQRLNNTLTTLFGGMAIASLLNSFLAGLYLCSAGRIAHELSPIRSVITNLFFTFVSWSMYLIHKQSIE